MCETVWSVSGGSWGKGFDSIYLCFNKRTLPETSSKRPCR